MKLIGIFKPSKTIGVNYLDRWHIVPRNRICNVYLHRFAGSDDDRAPHTHPWWSVSFLLRGSLQERRFFGNRAAGTWILPKFRPVVRSPDYSHIIIKPEGGPAWTLFITGPRVCEWFFWCPNGPVHYSKMTTPDGQQIGGCE